MTTTFSPAHWTLRAKLVVSSLLLVAVVMLGAGAATVVIAREYLGNQLAQDLTGVSTRLVNDRDHDRGPGPEDGLGGQPPGGGGGATLVLALRDNTVATNGAGYPINRVVDSHGNDAALDSTQIARLQAAQLGGEPKRLTIGGGVGTYLLVAERTSSGTVLVTGVPTKNADDALGALTAVLAIGTGIGLVLVGLGGSWLVRRNLEPLNRVAGTAERVSTLELHSGDVVMPERVPEADTDPRTEVGKVGLALNRMLDNVEDALQSRQESEMRVRQFVADASHELRTPLASIRGYAELSRREREPVPGSVTHAIGRVESEALRMQELVEDLLLLARLDSGRPLEREPVDLSLLAMDVVSDAHAAAPRHRWELDLPDEPVEVPGDRARLHQVLANLLANARTHTPEGTRVVTSVRDEGELVRISVTDNGPGIPESLQPNVFERFTRGDDARVRAGGSTGLGLSIVAAVGQAHGGRVELSSRPGETTFTVFLPAG